MCIRDRLKEVSKLIDQGEPIINMGIGSPDIFPSKKVIKALKRSLNDPSAHKYQSYYGLSELRSAISNFYKSFFGINLDPSKQVLPLIGSKEGIMHISLAFLNPGDKVLIPNPGYPTYLSVTKLVEAKPLLYELNENITQRLDFIDFSILSLDRLLKDHDLSLIHI